MNKPKDLEEKTVQWFLERKSLSYIERAIEEAKCEEEKHRRAIEHWEYIKWRMTHKKGKDAFVFR